MPRLSGLGTGEVKLANMAANSVDNSKQVFFESAQIALPVSAVVSAAHGFGQKPKRMQLVLVCVTAEAGYAIGDEIDITSGAFTTSGAQGTSNSSDATNIYLAAGGITYAAFNRSTTSYVGLTAANWRIVMRGWK